MIDSLRKFEGNLLKYEGGDRFLVKWFYLCASHKEPIEFNDFDRLYLKNYFELFKRLTMFYMLAKIKLYTITLTSKYQDGPSSPYALNICLTFFDL